MAAILTSVVAIAQNRTVTGVVMSEADDEPLAGATIQPVGGGSGVASDIDGKFTLSVPSTVSKLTVSYVGMVSQTVNITGKPLVVKLKSALNDLDEVMVVAYGTAKKSAYTGSASVVKADEIEQAMVTDAVNALRGKAAGVQILNASGQPGTSPTVLIRGVGSINAGTDPLYVVDGMPYDGEIAAINTMDIESMTVLKDAAAAALYGARGANGVILITTKRGNDGTAKVTLDARWGSNSRQIPNYNVIKSTAQYTELAYQSLYNSYLSNYTPAQANIKANEMLMGLNGNTMSFGAGYLPYTVPNGQMLIGTNGKLNPNATLGVLVGNNWITPDNWEDATFSNGLRQEYNLSINGGNDRFSFYMSGGYLKDEGIIRGSDYERFSARAAVDYQAKKWLKVGTNIAFNHVTTNSLLDEGNAGSGNNVIYIANNIAPIYPIYVRNAEGVIMRDDVTGNALYDYGDGKSVVNAYRNWMGRYNGIGQQLYDLNESSYDVFNGTWYATVTPIENLDITGKVNYFTDNTRYHNLQSGRFGQMTEYGGENIVESSLNRTLNLQALATYSHQIADVHNLNYLLGYESHERYDETVYGRGMGLYNPDNWTLNNTKLDDKRKAYSSAGSYATRGIFARVNYDYDGTYFASVSYRRDASSRFAPDKRWGNFFSVSAGWDIKKMSFMQDFTNVDMLKVKASFGQQGNDNIRNYYAYLDQYSIDGTSGTWSDGVLVYKGNPDITWETSNNINAGVDFSFFQGRIDGTVEYYQRQTSDMLYNKPVAPSNGYESIPMNVGSMRNNGFEIELNLRPVVTKDLRWELNFNGTFIKNKVLKLSPDLNGKLISGITSLREGHSMYEYYIVKYAGVNPENGNMLFWSREITGYEKDANGNDIADKPIYGEEYKTENYDEAYVNNRFFTGNTLPTFYGGFGTSVNFKGFDFAIQFAYQLGGRVFDNTYSSLMGPGDASSMGSNWHADILKAWTPENTVTDIPRLNFASQYSYSSVNIDHHLISSNYLSLNNITVGYTLPKSLTKKFFVDEIRVYAAGDNIALWSKRKGLDPRTGYSFLDNANNYSAIRNISGGIRVVF